MQKIECLPVAKLAFGEFALFFRDLWDLLCWFRVVAKFEQVKSQREEISFLDCLFEAVHIDEDVPKLGGLCESVQILRQERV